MLGKLKAKIRDLIRQEVRNGIFEAKNSLSVGNAPADPEKSAMLFKTLSAKASAKGLEAFKNEMKLALKNDDAEAALMLAQELANVKSASDSAYVQMAAGLRALILRKKDNEKYRDSLQTLFDLHYADEFTWREFQDVARMSFPVTQADSLIQQYVRRRRMRQIGTVPEVWLTYSKEAGELFAGMTEAPCLNTLSHSKIDAVKPQADVVVKPVVGRGSYATYLVKGLDNIFVPKDQITLTSWDEMLEHAHGLIDKRTIADDFLVQTFVYADKKKKTAAHDLKFYTFYGEIGCVNEIARDPGLAYWWYEPDGKPIDLGIENPPDVAPVGFKPEYIKLVSELSKKMPVPHMRIDFIAGEDGMYFCEFTSYTGSQVETIAEVKSPELNRKFGRMYLDAELRITNDLLAGKRFRELNKFNAICERRFLLR